ncbi:STM4015 family protein [Streptomyces qinzhouensis]|uniref:Leucine-rich repeat domain-containing protein n=1 Tax=Streptomyces qinzhouensis TaxID=2599401 RepID=A0A5B8JE05_9ACTN|nr:STM4015 family protein [Streptomyces qinzhouensis]QDY79975.1 leucine-rich repeat domain-containing protein [Streptomyces qinzhouensis]
MSELQELSGLPVFDFPTENEGGDSKRGKGRGKDTEAELPAAGAVAWRIAMNAYDSEGPWEDEFARFLTLVDTTEVRAFIVGVWPEAYESSPESIVKALVDAADRFPALRSLYFGDISGEECEISWINQGAVSPLLEAFPQLEEFGVRGGQDLELKPVRHERLRSLSVETGGLDAEVVRDIAASDFPALEILDLWLGTSEYGATASLEDLEPFLTGVRLPKLRHLALHNSDMQDRIAGAVASAPVVARLEVLDLSMGTLSDEGAQALLEGQPLTHLKKLDLSHHYLTEAMEERLRTTLGAEGVELDLSDSQYEEWDQDGDWDSRYVSVGE